MARACCSASLFPNLLAAYVLQTTSEKAIRKQLQQHFKTDINEKKALVKQHVSTCMGGEKSTSAALL
jgi:hypothetical protein